MSLPTPPAAPAASSTPSGASPPSHPAIPNPPLHLTPTPPHLVATPAPSPATSTAAASASPATHPTVKPALTAGAIHQVVEGWVADFIHNSPVARSTDAYNHLVAVLPQLEQRLNS